MGGREIFTGHTAITMERRGREIFTGHDQSSGKDREIFTGHRTMGRGGRSLPDTAWGLKHLDGFGAHLTVDLLFSLNVVKAEV